MTQRPRAQAGAPSSAYGRIVVCVDGSDLGERAIPHARAFAAAFGGSVTLLQVLEHAKPGQAPLDAVEWDIRRHEARDYVDQLARREPSAGEGALEAQVVEGAAAEEICRWTQHEQTDLTGLCTHGESGQSEWSLASTARKVVDRAPGSFLLVPATEKPSGEIARYERLLVPLDGSPRAESVLPVATRLAQAQQAELILGHVVPVPELTEVGPPAAEALELRERLIQRNERVATEYLDRLRAQLGSSGLSPRVLVLRGGEPRSQLARLIEEERVDLVILSAHGRGGGRDSACGSVAASLIANASRPLLVVRQRPARATRRVRAAKERGIRLPSQATP
jgi:nucleotide-binding universal stress UspA family protein